ncbi:hypothetical protein LTR78_006922 [Recurvomyces mirabilis]|uniref:Ribosomal protein S15 n=1 Tax=Recurvomyces mirabilis TaxID=574656 RepID=A0AAE0WJY6_9PEZI|nr:hypothetical protein LTR78_006922 [Recurvomyces mirabilis]KAK5153306.1 hypothetical protein LTS14_007475 [Recurvomyces mirabilis]
MPPRLPVPQCLRADATSYTCIYTRSFTSSVPSSVSASAQASKAAQHRRTHDPYAIAQAKARKAANLSRRTVLKEERAASLGNAVLGIETPFLRSFDTATRSTASEDQPRHTAPTDSTQRRNFFLTQQEIDAEIKHSEKLFTLHPDDPRDYDNDYTTESQQQQQREEDQATASEALKRISSLTLGSSEDRRRVNIQRCISTFGRHATDNHLTSVSRPDAPIAKVEEEKADQGWVIPRVGPDTGSSEVQIAILTAKIRTLSEFLQGRGRMDKVNKRNLRLLVHRRQKLLRYLQRSDKGGSRWQHCIEMLGLTEGTWKGEISL